MFRTSSIFLVVIFSFFFQKAFGNSVNQSAIEFCKLKFLVTTTSDWTKVQPILDKSKYVVTRSRILKGEMIKELKVNDEEFAVVKKPFNAEEVKIEFVINLPLTKDDFAFYITKGDIGETTIDVYNMNSAEPKYIGTFVNKNDPLNDPTNKVRYEIDNDKIKENGPVVAKVGNEYPKLVLSFYYPWFGSPSGPNKKWIMWDPNNHYSSPRRPSLGYYDSNDEETLKKHITLAKNAGIDVLIVSWWGINSLSDEAYEKLLHISEAEKYVTTIYYESAKNKDHIINDIKYILDKYSNSKAFLKLNGRPVLFIYGRVANQFGKDDWNFVFESLNNAGKEVVIIGERLSDIFDGIHIYNPIINSIPEIRSTFQQYSLYSQFGGKLFAATVIPGYDDTLIRKPGLKVEREDGRYYERSWEIAIESNPDWILITSFNEWLEGSEIEPSKEYGDLYLEITNKFAKKFKTLNSAKPFFNKQALQN